MPSSRVRQAAEPALVALVALLFAAPLLAMPYVPGLDLPWHAAVIEMLHRDDPARFLDYYEVRPRLSSYLTLYYAADAVAHLTGSVPAALRVVVAAYVIGFVWSARRLLRAFGGDGAAAVLAAPAAWCVTLEYGFLAYALAYPLTFWLWALARDIACHRPLAPRLVAAAVVSALIALTHPFAAAAALAGVVVIAGTDPGAGKGRSLALSAVTVAAAAPAFVALWALAGDAGASGPRLVREADLWTRLTTHHFTPVIEAVAAAPARLFGYAAPPLRFALAGAALCAAVWARYLSGPRASARPAAWLVVVMALAYLVTPFSFEWPRVLHAAQVRLLPLLWVAALALLAWRPPASGAGARVRAAPVAVAACAVAVTWHALAPLAAEARDLRAVISAAAPRVRTLGLIEQRPTREREPASPWRNAPVYVLVERGGFVANVPFLSAAVGPGVLVPSSGAGAPEVPPAPPLHAPGRFDPERHLAPYDQILIRDLDPASPREYLGDRGVLIERRGRWRLYSVPD